MVEAQRRVSLSVLNVAGWTFVVAVNVLANAVPLGGSRTGQISDLYPNLLVPAGLTFSVWGVIYLLLAGWVVYGVISSGKTEEAGAFIDRIGALFLVTCAANAGWIFSWHYRRLILSLVCIAVLLAALIAIYRRLDVGRSAAPPIERCLVHLPTSVYLGWISIASIANVTAVLAAFRWGRFGLSEQFWAVVMVAAGTALGLVALFRRNDVFFALVVDWAVLGILIKRMADAGSPTPWVRGAAIAGICLLTLGSAVQVVRRRVYR